MDIPVSHLELTGTVLSLTAVILMAFRNILTYPIGIVASILTAILLYHFSLYANMTEFVYYIGINIYGWYLWVFAPKDETSHVEVNYSSKKSLIVLPIVMVFVSLCVGVLNANLHNIFPRLIPTPASFPFPDAFTTVFAFYAMWVQVKRKIECWYLWIVVNIGYIIMYLLKGLPLYSILTIIYLLIAFFGLFQWTVSYRQNKAETVSA